MEPRNLPPMEKTNLGCSIFTSFVKTYFQAGAVCTSVKGTHMLLPIVITWYNVGPMLDSHA